MTHFEDEPYEDQRPHGVTHVVAAMGEGRGAGRQHLERAEYVPDLLTLVVLVRDMSVEITLVE